VKLTKEQVEMIKDSAENSTMKHGYDMTIIELCTDWLEMYDGLEFTEETICIGDVDMKIWIAKS